MSRYLPPGGDRVLVDPPDLTAADRRVLRRRLKREARAELQSRRDHGLEARHDARLRQLAERRGSDQPVPAQREHPAQDLELTRQHPLVLRAPDDVPTTELPTTPATHEHIVHPRVSIHTLGE